MHDLTRATKTRLVIAVASICVGTVFGVVALSAYLRFDEFLLRFAMWWG